MRFSLAGLLFLAALGCAGGGGEGGGGGGLGGSKDSDDDGLTDKEETELGTDPDNADTDGDGLSDLDEADGVTDPTNADSDADGADDGAEVEAGSDPNVTDTDGDGYSDGDEITQGLSATDPEDHPYMGGWPIDTACRDTIESTGWKVGDIAEDFTLTDQYGEGVTLSDFCGKTILLVTSAFW